MKQRESATQAVKKEVEEDFFPNTLRESCHWEWLKKNCEFDKVSVTTK